MSDVEDYRLAVRQVTMAACLLAEHDIPALLRAIDRAEIVGPLAHPTLYREKSQAMFQDREFLEAALPLWSVGQKIRAATQIIPSP